MYTLESKSESEAKSEAEETKSEEVHLYCFDLSI